ncbi:MAG: tRNA (adenosine(37)-N6)-threonylcarbamoyltransferase complex transferase subunit TsaD, partial [Methylobacterium sp.]
FQAAVVDVVVDRARVALRAFSDVAGRPTALVAAGGVAANGAVRRALASLAGEAGLSFVAPPLPLCGDNGAMIAWAGLERLRLGLVDDLTAPARPRWPLAAAPARAAVPAG